MLLAGHFLERYNARYKKKMTFSKEVANALANYQWPGNVRELENFIQSLVVTRDKPVIELKDLPAMMLTAITSTEGKSLGEIMDGIEKEILRKALTEYPSIALIAKHFKVDRVTIYRKLKKYQLAE